MGDDGVLPRLAQWAFAKAWLGCVFSGVYALGGHFGWPGGVLTAAAVLAAVALAVTVAWLPGWTHERPTGIRVADIGARALVWTGFAAAVAGLLVGSPAVGAVAGALLLDTARRTFAPGWDPLRALRPRPMPPRSHPAAGVSRARKASPSGRLGSRPHSVVRTRSR
ncbi:hypothetical protein [Symbioplanes lichenis]|uniref:hypothetical protein n=1 Tax=Symbioplanes lichenis TaxID=1629072 RepID=UPI0027394B49|nr:hypothetical protein [Actinoplanes lichenis]